MWFLIWMSFAILVGVLSKSRDSGFWYGFLWSVFLSPIVGVAIVFMTDDMKNCPKCAEKVKIAAVRCKHCAHEFEQQEPIKQITS